jgi:hypothetical protein
MPPDLDRLAPRDVLITRRGFDPEPQASAPGGHTLARHLKGRLTLAEAVTATQAIDPDVDASAILTLILSPPARSPSTLDPDPDPKDPDRCAP